jgi:hypothetical protein
VDLSQLLRLVLRYWYVTVPTLLLTAVASLMASQAVRPAYLVTANVVLLAPNRGDAAPEASQSPPPPANPYLHFDRNLEVVAGVLATILTNEQMVDRLRSVGATADYDVGVPTGSGSLANSASPMLRISSKASTPEAAQRTVSIVAHYLNVELARRQRAAGAPDGTLIRAQLTTPPTVTARLVGSTARAVGATVVAGLIVTTGLARLLDAGRRRRERVRRSRRAASSRRTPPVEPAMNWSQSRPPQGFGDRAVDLDWSETPTSPQRLSR